MTVRHAAVVLAFAMSNSFLLADDWPQWLGPKRDGVWRETGIVEQFPEGGPKILWRIPIGAGYTGPAVADGRVYLMDRQTPKERDPSTPKGTLPGTERVLCLDAKSGKEIWKHEYDCPYVKISYPSGPRTTPLVHQGKVYTLGTMGRLICFAADSGKILWSKDVPKEYKCSPPVWGYSAHLLIDGEKLISLVGGDGSAAVAWNKDTGKEIWRTLTNEDVGYAPPTIVTVGKSRRLIIWLSDCVNMVDLETGKELWTVACPEDGKPMRPNVTIATPRFAGDLLFLTSGYHGPLGIRIAEKGEPKVLYRGKSNNPGKPDRLHTLMSTPVFKDGHIYGACSMGNVVCLRADSGEKLWSSFQAIGGKEALFGTIFFVENAGRFFLFNDQGDLIIAKMSPKGYEEVSRANLVKPSQHARGRDVVWSHPAFANKCVYVRNDKEIVCASLSAE
jgi:outer membrane protein assembly factor BamB